MTTVTLQEQIAGLIASSSIDPEPARAVFAELRAALSQGTVRAAEPDSASQIGRAHV